MMRTPISSANECATKYAAHATVTRTNETKRDFLRPAASTRYPENSRAMVAPTTKELEAKPPAVSDAPNCCTAYKAMIVTNR